MTAPLKVRVLSSLRKEPDWSAMSADDVRTFAEQANRQRSKPLMRLVLGFPDRDAVITWENVALPDREIPVRVLRPARSTKPLPLVVHVHGGGFVGTALQCDWVTSQVAARLPAVVVSVEHRLVNEDMPLTAAIDDGWDVLTHIAADADRWGVDPGNIAVFGESCGALIVSHSAFRARESGPRIRAQILVNPPTDLTPVGFDFPSMHEHADSASLTVEQMRFICRLAAPDGTGLRELSPLHAEDLSGLPPTLVVVPALDPLADQGRAYAARLRDAGTPVELAEYERAIHGFLSTPGLIKDAKPARDRVLGFLAEHLGQR